MSMQPEVYRVPNNTGILLSDSSNNVIGGTSAAARNVISGNKFTVLKSSAAATLFRETS